MPGRFYPVVDDAAWVRRVVRAGAQLVQLRIKAGPDGTLDRDRLGHEVWSAEAACREHGATLVLNDHWRLAIDRKLSFLHLGQEDLDDADLPAIRRAGLRLGVSTHSAEELDRALSVAPDYVALGPVWPTTLKVMPWAPQGTDRLSDWKRRLGDVPLVAIGGVTLERVPACLEAGADAVAVVSDVTRAADPDDRARRWAQACGDLPPAAA
ncbi:thiamine phosphate synthase [Rhizosaccharibacter radicis]|uniref:Thiamine phosphate synthase n=1 Tax=Rhizosaccharibacter radicis TaxID=2782605 RepID=A0ABT1VWL5_9PROT|nr:thiamine phosphate synthase [Acetobacteraceae bacterium KSS12]